LLAPGSAFAFSEHMASGFPSLARAQRSDSLDLPLLGFDPPPRCFPKSPPSTSRSRAPLLGFQPLQRLWVTRVHVLAGCPAWHPRRFLAENSLAGPTPPVTVPLTGFPNLSAVSSSPRLPAIFRQVALLGFRPTGVCSFHEAPTAHRHRRTLLTFFPRVAQLPS
jgi:hypothetical protein